MGVVLVKSRPSRSGRGFACSLAKSRDFFQERVFHLELTYVLLNFARFALAGLGVEFARDLAPHLSAVFGFNPSSLQHFVMGLPVEMM